MATIQQKYPYSETHEFWDELGKCWYICCCLNAKEKENSLLPHREKGAAE